MEISIIGSSNTYRDLTKREINVYRMRYIAYITEPNNKIDSIYAFSNTPLFFSIFDMSWLIFKWEDSVQCAVYNRPKGGWLPGGIALVILVIWLIRKRL